MPIGTGTRLGSYELLAQIGAGGMGEVYEARDTKLGRNVAIKVLPAAFVNDPERLSRFQREAPDAGLAESSQHRYDLWAGAVEYSIV
jgi:serine/threonine protein kinase